MPQLVQAQIISQMQVRPGVYLMELSAPELAHAARPGQFLHIRCGDSSDPLLRRPISIHGVDRVKGVVQILFQVVGRGTRLLATGWFNTLDVLGPLGHGFTLPGAPLGEDSPKSKAVSHWENGWPDKFIIVGGGMGVAPLYFLMQELKSLVDASRILVLMGASNAQGLLIRSQVERLGLDMQIATDDGSVGHQGTVVDVLAAVLAPNKGQHNLTPATNYVYACGPKPMLKAVCALLNQTGVAGQVSVEEKMACGVGACLSCACKVQDATGEKSYRRACMEGPVFLAQEVVFDD